LNDLFPDLLRPEAMGFDAIRLGAPVFFAIYPMAADLPRIVEWQQRICGEFEPPKVELRPPEILHISVAACGKPTRQRQPLKESLQAAAERFSYPSFELTLVASTRFGGDDRALVAVADANGSRAVHGLRLAIADAQKTEGLSGSRSRDETHLTLGYRDGLPAERRAIEPISFRVETVDLAVSLVGHTKHVHFTSWRLTS
jgi:2'-5' RNA ligase